MPWQIKFRQWVADKLVYLAWKIYKQSPEVIQFISQRSYDEAITGKSITRVDPQEFYTEDPAGYFLKNANHKCRGKNADCFVEIDGVKFDYNGKRDSKGNWTCTNCNLPIN